MEQEQSDCENDLNLLNISKSRGKHKVLDSDSESETRLDTDIPKGNDEMNNEEVLPMAGSPKPDLNTKHDDNEDNEQEDVITEDNIKSVKCHSRRPALAESDSETDSTMPASHNVNLANDNESNPGPEPQNEVLPNDTNKRRKSRLMTIADSDSDEDAVSHKTELNEVTDNNESPTGCTNNTTDTNNCNSRHLAIAGSDSETDSTMTATHDKDFTNDKESNPEPELQKEILLNDSNKRRKSRLMAIADSDSDEDTISHKTEINETDNNESLTTCTTKTTDTNDHKSILSALCDSESDYENASCDERAPHSPTTKPKKYTKKKEKQEKPPKPMTGREALQQRKEIHSESQRMLRESRISLPYHKPKSYSLKEFLEKRSKLPTASAVIPKAPPSIAIKMSKGQLEIVSKALDERIKVVEEFYKSDSDHDHDNYHDHDHEDNCQDQSDLVSKEIESLLYDLVEKVELDCQIAEAVPEPENNGEDDKPALQVESMEYDFNLDDIEEKDANLEEQPTKKPNKLDLIKDRISNVQPRLSGGPDEIIDLEEGVTKPDEIKKLVERFIQHSIPKNSHKHKVELNIMSVSGGQIHNETVAMNVDEDQEPVTTMEVPGAKLQKLRQELESQMAQKRSELWQQKRTDTICNTTDDNNEKLAQFEDDILDDEEEIEMTESSSSEDEIEEDFDCTAEKPKPKSDFLDDEADESDVQDDDNDCGFDGDNEQEQDRHEDDNNMKETEFIDNSEEPATKKVLKRIVKPFDEDSEDEESKDSNPLEDSNCKNLSEKEENSSAASCEGDCIIPPNLPSLHKTPQRPTQSPKSNLEFLTPVTYLTGLQNLNSDSKFLKESPVLSPFRMPMDPSPLKDKNWQSNLQKKLFQDTSETQQSQVGNFDELSELCSGAFPDTQNCEVEDAQSSTQDLLNVCSGAFTAGTQLEHVRDNTTNEVKNSDEDHEAIISQLLDEDEMEQFKKKFDSPVGLHTKNEEVNATGLINSDEENDELEVKQRKQKKLIFSDSSDEDDAQQDDEEIDLHADYDDELVEDVAYDSEENEVVKLKPSDFFENEAELSDSEWGSADEDEKGLDDLEFEKGDEEHFDENKMRSDLEKIHMRRLLDDDNREVKLLQELLLEDGELHGSGRQRQFRWKNIDSVDTGDSAKQDDEDGYLDEEESEEHWRKKRHQREMYLKQKSQDQDIDSILSDSQVLSSVQKVVVKSQSSNTPNNNKVIEEKETSFKSSFSLLNKRGSFLSRGDQVLQRVAEYTKVSSNIAGSVKNSRSFLFQTVSTVETAPLIKTNKRKVREETPKVIKKLRLTDMSPNVDKIPTSRGPKQLFTN